MGEYIKMPINGYHTDEPVYTLLDIEDYELVNRWKWQQGKTGYARRNKMITLSDGTKQWRVLQLHRVILGLQDEEIDGFCVDHINGDRLDNRKSNLRVATLSENASNRHTILASTGMLCVSELSGKYIARVRREKESFYLGSYDTAEEASNAIKLFDKSGEVAKEIQRPHPVEQYDLDGNFLNRYTTNAEAQRQTGVIASNISRCANGKRETAGGYKWQYADAECPC